MEELKVHKKDLEDEFGWLVGGSAGGWKKERKRRQDGNMGPGSPMEKVNILLDETKEQLLQMGGEAAVTIEVFVTEAWAAQKRWLEVEGGQIIEAAKKAGNLDEVAVPTPDFLLAGLTAALKTLQEQLTEAGGQLAEYATAIAERLGAEELPTLTELRITFDQTLQHFVMEKVETFVFPTLGSKYDAFEIGGPFAKQIKTTLFNLAEDLVRKQLHRNVVSTFKDIAESLCPPGCKLLLETLDPKMKVDGWGWLNSEGGFAKFRKAAGGGAAGMMEMVDQCLDPSIVAQLEELTGEVGPTVGAYLSASKAAFEEWSVGSGDLLKTHLEQHGLSQFYTPLVEDLGVLKLEHLHIVDAAMLAQIGMKSTDIRQAMDISFPPIAQFQKPGLLAALAHIKPTVIQIGGPLADRVNALNTSAEQHSTGLRRSLDQLLQEVIVSKARETVFPEIDKLVGKIKKLRGPMAGPIKTKVVGMVYDMAEGIVRKETHKQALTAYQQVSDTMPEEMRALAAMVAESESEGGSQPSCGASAAQ